MEVVVLQNPAHVGRFVADLVVDLVERRPDAVLGLATGSSPIPTYRELIHRHRDGIEFQRTTTFLLDEYVGLASSHPASYRRFIDDELTDHLDIDASNVHGPAGDTNEPHGEAERYERAIAAAGGIDLQLLGIGADGHVGFNEPMSSLSSRTRIKTLTNQTRSDNARFFDGQLNDVPRHVITQGIGTILDARHCILIATGPAKADPVARSVEGPLQARCPASALQLHRHATIVLDEDAASRLEFISYYKEAFAGRDISVAPSGDR